MNSPANAIQFRALAVLGALLRWARFDDPLLQASTRVSRRRRIPSASCS